MQRLGGSLGRLCPHQPNTDHHARYHRRGCGRCTISLYVISQHIGALIISVEWKPPVLFRRCCSSERAQATTPAKTPKPPYLLNT